MELVDTRLKTVRTRVSRILKSCRPSGSGTDDCHVPAEILHLRWLFPHIRSRQTVSNLSLSSKTTSDNDDEEKEELNDSTTVTEDKANEEASSSTPKMAGKVKKRKPGKSSSDKVDEAILEYLKSKQQKRPLPETEGDDTALFLRSLAPKIRRLSPEMQCEVQMEMLNCINRKITAMTQNFNVNNVERTYNYLQL